MRSDVVVRYLCFFLVVLFLATLNSAAFAADVSVVQYPVGKATVWAIADSVGERDVNIFAGADAEVLAKYVPSGKAPSATMTSLVKLGNDVILLDTGNGNDSSQLLSGLKEAGVTPEQVTMILITHMHGDHIGGLVKDGSKVFPAARILSSKVEYDFWLNPKHADLLPERKSNFELAQKTFGIYASASETFEFGSEVFPGIQALDSRGHTPGHTSFLLESDGEKILFWGDLVHAVALQFPRPDMNARYDMNQTDAIASRAKFMEKAATEKLTIAGVHLPFPAVGTVEKTAEGGYKFISR